jgi:hypothetical protein
MGYMGKLSKEKSRRRWAEIRGLLNEWDPIGIIGGPDLPEDEYDCLARPLSRLMERESSKAEIANQQRMSASVRRRNYAQS